MTGDRDKDDTKRSMTLDELNAALDEQYAARVERARFLFAKCIEALIREEKRDEAGDVATDALAAIFEGLCQNIGVLDAALARADVSREARERRARFAHEQGYSFMEYQQGEKLRIGAHVPFNAHPKARISSRRRALARRNGKA